VERELTNKSHIATALFRNPALACIDRRIALVHRETRL